MMMYCNQLLAVQRLNGEVSYPLSQSNSVVAQAPASSDTPNSTAFDTGSPTNEVNSLSLRSTTMTTVPRTTVQCSQITHAPKKRPYNYVNRVPAIQKKTIRKKKWLKRLQSMTVGKLRITKCCKLRCFRKVSYDHWIERSRFMLSSTTAGLWNVLTSFKISDGTYQFDGKRVCVVFLKKSFRFSTEVVAAVRNVQSSKGRHSRSNSGGS